jgi:transcriptional regulator with XRE-family HTH domain
MPARKGPRWAYDANHAKWKAVDFASESNRAISRRLGISPAVAGRAREAAGFEQNPVGWQGGRTVEIEKSEFVKKSDRQLSDEYGIAICTVAHKRRDAGVYRTKSGRGAKELGLSRAGAVLDELRQSTGMSLYKLAEASGVSTSALYDLADGVTDAYNSQISRFCEYWGIARTQLMDEVPPELLIFDDSYEPHSVANKDDAMRRLRQAARIALSPREMKVVMSRSGGDTLDVTGELIGGVTRERARQIYLRAIRKLKSYLNLRRLEDLREALVRG